METFAELKGLVSNQHYQVQREKSLNNLTDDMIDIPIINTINIFNKLPYCFTLQSCYGHFVHSGNKYSHNLEPLPVKDVAGKVEYRIAYIAFCIENNQLGRELFEAFENFPTIDPQNVQFCCAEWFWKRQVNSYALQVEPDRYKRKDKVILDFEEARHIEKIRSKFFIHLHELLERHGGRVKITI